MNRTILLAVCMVYAFYPLIIAQNSDPSLFGTGGGMTQGGSTFLSYSFGEPFIFNNQNENTWITEGFQQPEKIDVTTSVSNIDGSSSLNIFPNPATSEINAEWKHLPACTNVRIQNILGQTMHSDRIDLKENVLLSLDHLQPGIYWLSIQCGIMQSITKSFIKL